MILTATIQVPLPDDEMAWPDTRLGGPLEQARHWCVDDDGQLSGDGLEQLLGWFNDPDDECSFAAAVSPDGASAAVAQLDALIRTVEQLAVDVDADAQDTLGGVVRELREAGQKLEWLADQPQEGGR